MAAAMGSKVVDTVSGFAGMVTARCEYLAGTPRILVESQTLHDGKPMSEWFEESRLTEKE